MPDVSAVLGASWGLATGVRSGPLAVVWGRATDVRSLGGPYTPGAAPPGGTPTSPNTDADFVIGPGPVYVVNHTITIVDLRDDAPIELFDVTISTDDGAVCWTLSARAAGDLFERFTTGDEPPVIEIDVDGNVWRFVIEGIRRSRAFDGRTLDITGRSLSILAGEPYQFPQNWVNDGPATAQQIAAQAQIFTGLQIDWELEDWLVPDRAFTYYGSPLSVVQRVAEAVGAVVKADRLDSRITLMPRYRALPNEWQELVPEVEIHLDPIEVDSYDRSDRPSFNGIYVAGQADGALALIYLAGTSGDKLAPMVTDQLLTEDIALRQRGTTELGKGGPQATISLTLPVLNDPGYPGVFELNWLCRVIEPGLTWYGVVRSVSVSVGFPDVKQTITLERHTAYITGTVREIPATPPAPTVYLAWRNPINSPTGAASAYESNSGTAPFDGGVATVYYAMVAPSATGTVVWSSSWSSPVFGDPAPGLLQSGNDFEITFSPGELSTQTSRGTLLLTATIDGVPVVNRLRLVAAEDGLGDVQITWSSEVLP